MYHIVTSEASGDETRPSGSRPTISVAAPTQGGTLTDILASLAPFRAAEGRTPVVDVPFVEEETRPVSPPAASASGPPRVKIVGEPRSRPEPAVEGEEPPAKRPALVVHKSSPGKVPQKARPRVGGTRGRAGVIRRPRALTTPLSAVLLMAVTRPLSPRVCRHLSRVLPTAHWKKSGDQSGQSLSRRRQYLHLRRHVRSRLLRLWHLRHFLLHRLHRRWYKVRSSHLSR